MVGYWEWDRLIEDIKSGQLQYIIAQTKLPNETAIRLPEYIRILIPQYYHIVLDYSNDVYGMVLYETNSK
jgi:hypothetical protein